MDTNVAHQKPGLLAPYRVLDLTDEKGFFCGKMLGQLGADVIKIEPPGGHPARKTGPFYHDVKGPEKSLSWLAFNSDKRGITLNIENAEGKQIFKRLLSGTDLVIESFEPRYLDGIGLGYEGLSKTKPDVVLTSITPFGQTGPYQDFKGSDLTVWALSGFMYLCGDTDRPPVRISFPQAFLHASTHAAAGSMLALYHRRKTGQGQHVDVSAQEACSWFTVDAQQYWDLCQMNQRRAGHGRYRPATGVTLQVNWICKDGHVCYWTLGGAAGARCNRALVAWMDEEGMADDIIKSVDWDDFDWEKITQDRWNAIAEPMARFFSAHTKDELYDGAVKRRIFFGPVATAKDMLSNPQLNARGFWKKIEHSELRDSLTYPGSFVKSSAADCTIRRRAPIVGEHNKEVYQGELGLSQEELASLERKQII